MLHVSRLITAIALTNCLLRVGLAQVPDDFLTFEVASIKLHNPDQSAQSSQKGGPGTRDPGRIVATYRPLQTLLTDVYGVKAYQIQLPEEFSSARYDITANVPPGTTKEQARVMMRNLLLDRLRLKVHRDTKTMRVMALVLAKGGPKLRPSDSVAATHTVIQGDGKVDADGFPIASVDPVKGGMAVTSKELNMKLVAVKQTMAQLVAKLQPDLDVPVIDETGLAGAFDFSIRYAGEWRRADSNGQSVGDVVEGDGPRLAEALEKELGLKLVPRKMQIDMMVVDAGQKTPIEK
jgi:uncharacterized protein (TIGR03435 family)